MSWLLQDGCNRLELGKGCKEKSSGRSDAAAISLTRTASNSVTAEVMRPLKRGRWGL